MSIEEFLRSKNMTVIYFSNSVNCSRQVIWRMKNDLPISPRMAKRIFEFTGGLVDHPSTSRGKDKKNRGSNDNA